MPTRDQSVMSFGDHLEELRRRLIWALAGPVPILIAALAFGGPILAFLIAPLERQLAAAGQPVRLLATSPVEPFGAYLKVATAAAVLVSAPWILYQAWLFVAPGLYRSERRFVYVLMPLSAVMTAASMLFFYTAMLPVMLRFFIVFGAFIVQPNPGTAPVPEGLTLPTVPVLAADPPDPAPGQMWINERMNELRVATGSPGAVAVVGAPLASGGAIAQQYRVGEYVNLVFGLALVLAVAFQLPVAMLLAGWVGLVRPADLTPWRKHVLFGCAIAGAIFTPADPGSMLLLMVPLYALFEFGLVLMRVVPASVARADDEPSP
ncbi:MAG: preprotein translocase subunit TatC [Planctomycetota bacterium]|nr:MAG: preprotein translocase subunit TatC [Planctomycetota bacterium]